jgi:hypothetical protein
VAQRDRTHRCPSLTPKRSRGAGIRTRDLSVPKAKSRIPAHAREQSWLVRTFSVCRRTTANRGARAINAP